VAALGIWAWQQNRLEDASLRQTIGQLQQQLNTSAQQRQQLEVALEQLQQQTATVGEQQQLTERHLEQLHAQYEVLVTQMQTLDGRRSADWLVAEADYLVRMAGRKIWLDRDLRTAMMLLGNADERLAQLADPAVLAARTAIAEDLQMLSQLNPVSRTSVALSLRGLYTQIDSLPLQELSDAQTSNKPQQTDKVTDWRHNLGVIWQGKIGRAHV
jgi:uroporphyrin-3 C-methyltransferase